MTNPLKLQPQQQLRNPYCKRSMRFSKNGYEALMDFKSRLEVKLGRPISESVTIDMLLAGATI